MTIPMQTHDTTSNCYPSCHSLPAYIRVVLTLIFSMMVCLLPLTLFAQESKSSLETQPSLSPPVTLTEQVNYATNVIAVLKITVTDNDNNVGRTTPTELPEDLTVQGNYPNPFHTETKIVFNLPEQARVYTEVFDILGRVVYTSQTQQMEAGWDRTLSVYLPQTSPGLYIYRVNMETVSGTISRTGRIIQVR